MGCDTRRDNPAPSPGSVPRQELDRVQARIIGMVSLRPLATIDGEAGSEWAI